VGKHAQFLGAKIPVPLLHGVSEVGARKQRTADVFCPTGVRAVVLRTNAVSRRHAPIVSTLIACCW
jgi:hypothetical protein